jgi:hypothetical protein
MKLILSLFESQLVWQAMLIALSLYLANWALSGVLVGLLALRFMFGYKGLSNNAGVDNKSDIPCISDRPRCCVEAGGKCSKCQSGVTKIRECAGGVVTLKTCKSRLNPR